MRNFQCDGMDDQRLLYTFLKCLHLPTLFAFGTNMVAFAAAWRRAWSASG
jgi:hypothetical protein